MSKNLYTVKYKAITSKFWKKLKRVQGDGIASKEMDFPTRYFILEDESRVEIATPGMMFHFGKERFYSIKDNANETAGQEIKLKK